MDKNRKALVLSLLTIFVFMLVSFLAPSADAHGRGRGGACGMGGMACMGGPDGPEGTGPHGEGPGLNYGKYLDLSTEQRQKMHDVKFGFMKKTLDLRSELGKKSLERKALLESEAVDWKKVDQTTDEIARIKANLEKENMRQKTEMKKILTKEQLEKLNSMNCPKGQAGGLGCGIGKGPGAGLGMGKGLGCGAGKGLGL
ncbi:MAG: Spy/CpxP family protein refolding chaperone [bacterium]